MNYSPETETSSLSLQLKSSNISLLLVSDHRFVHGYNTPSFLCTDDGPNL